MMLRNRKQCKVTHVLLLDLCFLLGCEVVDNVEELTNLLGCLALDHVRNRFATDVTVIRGVISHARDGCRVERLTEGA